MPGGSEKAWLLIKPIFQAIAAKVGPTRTFPAANGSARAALGIT